MRKLFGLAFLLAPALPAVACGPAFTPEAVFLIAGVVLAPQLIPPAIGVAYGSRGCHAGWTARLLSWIPAVLLSLILGFALTMLLGLPGYALGMLLGLFVGYQSGLKIRPGEGPEEHEGPGFSRI